MVGERPSVANHTSYAHDFTECQVDAEILEYFETQQKNSHQHRLADSLVVTASTSGSPRLMTSPKRCSVCDKEPQGVAEHRLSNCPSISPSTTQKVQQRNLIDGKHLDPIKPPKSGTLSTPECCIEDSQTSTTLLEHDLEDCTKRNSVVYADVDTVDQCQPSGKETRQPLEDCDLCEAIVVAKEHRLSLCSRSSSMNALHKPKAQPHRLSQCPRSCSMPVIASQNASQHKIEDCQTNEDNAEKVQSHVLEECEVLPAEESCDLAEFMIKVPKPLRNKREQSADDRDFKLKRGKLSRSNRCSSKSGEAPTSTIKQETKSKMLQIEQPGSCNVPLHADLESQLQAKDCKTAQHPDIIVGVDVVVAGRKVKAEIIPVFDGPASTRSSQIRPASAQQALTNLLAISRKRGSVSRRVSQRNSRSHPYQRHPRGQVNPQNFNEQDNNVVILGTLGRETMTARAVEKKIEK